MSAGDWEMVVGLEVHVQLRTRTKAFCPCSAAYGAAPNANTCPVCLALPGALPVLNEHAVALAARAALALNCTVNTTSVFARKHYFYPDLPKGYQITQYDKPLASGGFVDIGGRAGAPETRIGVTRVHMEEDAGKSVHDRFAGASAIDLNRSGVPLAEIVSEPDIRSAEQAGAYLRVLKQLLQYTDVSDVNMEEGSLRVDANVSVRRPGTKSLGTKTELKNLNSFSGVERALAVEFARQVALIEAGGQVQQQTMLWDEDAESRCGPVAPRRGVTTIGTFPNLTCRHSCSPATGSIARVNPFPNSPRRAPSGLPRSMGLATTIARCSPPAPRSRITSRAWRAHTATPRTPQTG